MDNFVNLNSNKIGLLDDDICTVVDLKKKSIETEEMPETEINKI